jgi:RNA-directed DNA polymerase
MIHFDTVAQLASVLDTTEANLYRLVRQRKQLYKHDIEIKPNGKQREFFKPKFPLKIVQKAIDQNILARFRVNSLVYGFIKGGSPQKCACQLVGCPCLLWVDISSFFPSISYHQVLRFFSTIANPPVARMLTDLTTWQNQLPQGTPTSPRLSNLANKSLDNRLGGLAQKHHLKIARYGDDIYFGGPRWISNLLDTVQKIVADEGYTVNAEKAEKGGIQFQDNPQVVLSSLIVNRTIGIAPNYYDEVQASLSYIKRFGWTSAISKGIVKSQESLRG